MKRSPDHPEDLAVLARRGQLSSEQLEQLGRTLQGSATLWIANQVGRAFDRAAEVHEGDEQRIAEWVDRVMARRRAPARRLWRGWRVGLVAAMVLMAASAAGVVGWRYSNRAEQAPARPAAPAAVSPSKAAAARPRSTPVPSPAAQEPLAAPPEPAETPAPKRSRGSEPQHSAPAPTANQREPRPQTSAQLFSRANAARRKGHYDRAIAGYAELQKLYPGSAEASMSYVSLGRLLLARGLAAKALEQFSRYLRGRGPLEQEALLGKARALAALGRRDEERAVWKRLVARYPGSLYAAEAKEQLGEVDRSLNP